MFWHLYKYRVKVLLKNKYLLFWMGLFPVILGTFFYLAFSDIAEKTEQIDSIRVVVTTEKEADKKPEDVVFKDKSFKTFLDSMKDREMFELTYADYENAAKLLSEGKADGVLVVTDNNRYLCICNLSITDSIYNSLEVCSTSRHKYRYS